MEGTGRRCIKDGVNRLRQGISTAHQSMSVNSMIQFKFPGGGGGLNTGDFS